MAITKIWDIQKRSTRDLIDYCTNPEKTESGQLVSGINCSAETANREFWITKNSYGKTDKILAFHGLQSFNPGEVTPEQAHKIGMELAQKLWGNRFQILVCTHTDREHIHNHFVINSVSFIDGKKYNDCNSSYALLQKTSDELCREYALSVIDSPKQGKTKPYAVWKAEKENRPTLHSTTKADVDKAIREAFSLKQFFTILQNEGYEIKQGADITIRAIGRERGLKLARNFGEQYTLEAIRRRILEQPPPRRKAQPPKQYKSKKYRYYGLFPLHRRKSFRALYWHYCYLLGIFPKSRAKQGHSRAQREDIQKIRKISEEAILLCHNRIDTTAQLQAFQEDLTEQIERLSADRKHLYNRIRHCRDEKEKAGYKEQISALTIQIRKLKRQEHLCNDIFSRSKKIKEQIQIEAQTMKKRRKELNKSNEYVR